MKKAKLYRGGLKNVRGEKQQETLTGRPENQQHKANFRSGPHARTDPNAGRVTPLIPSHQIATKRATKTVHREGGNDE